jgi:hypothetical protein
MISGGVVYDDPEQLSRWGEPFNVGNGAVIPPGAYFTTGGFTIRDDSDAVISTHAAGFCISDGKQVKAAAAIQVIPVGAKRQSVWPWVGPWPLANLPWPATKTV